MKLQVVIHSQTFCQNEMCERSISILSIIKPSLSHQQNEGFGVMSEPDDGLERAGELPSRFDIFDPTQGIENEAKALTEGDLFSKLFFNTLPKLRR